MIDARKKGEEHDIKAARDVIETAIKSIQSSTSVNDKLCQNLIRDLEEVKPNEVQPAQFTAVSQKLVSYGQSHMQQRSVGQASLAYATPVQQVMQSVSKAYVNQEQQPQSRTHLHSYTPYQVQNPTVQKYVPRPYQFIPGVTPQSFGSAQLQVQQPQQLPQQHIQSQQLPQQHIQSPRQHIQTQQLPQQHIQSQQHIQTQQQIQQLQMQLQQSPQQQLQPQQLPQQLQPQSPHWL